jgi:hypothetical protein
VRGAFVAASIYNSLAAAAAPSGHYLWPLKGLRLTPRSAMARSSSVPRHRLLTAEGGGLATFKKMRVSACLMLIVCCLLPRESLAQSPLTPSQTSRLTAAAAGARMRAAGSPHAADAEVAVEAFRTAWYGKLPSPAPGSPPPLGPPGPSDWGVRQGNVVGDAKTTSELSEGEFESGTEAVLVGGEQVVLNPARLLREPADDALGDYFAACLAGVVGHEGVRLTTAFRWKRNNELVYKCQRYKNTVKALSMNVAIMREVKAMAGLGHLDQWLGAMTEAQREQLANDLGKRLDLMEKEMAALNAEILRLNCP